MIRIFKQHSVRMHEALDGRWDFVTGRERRGGRNLPSRYNRTIHVPSAWETIPGMESYRGKGWFRRKISAVDGLAVRLVFGGVSPQGTVYIDGRRVGCHEDAFTPWDVVVPGLKSGSRELVVEVDNTFGEHSALHRENDYYTYGGITRPAELHHVPAVYIDNIYATPRKEKNKWMLDARICLKNWTSSNARRRLSLRLGTSSTDLGSFTIKAEASREVSGVISNLDVEPWDSSHPNLYNIEAVLFNGQRIEDDMVERVGFREVVVKGRKILLNGSPVRLQGYNRHEDHPHFGNALPVEAMNADLEIMRDMGCNAVRTSHYPNDMRFLDLCDEMGIYVWEEAHARQVDFKHPAFNRQIEQSTREMVNWHFNRPSIIIWGCLNECDSLTQAGRAVHRRMLKLLRKMDGSRPVTFASNKLTKDICLDLADIVSLNLYPGWYSGDISNIEPALGKALQWIHSRASGAKGKPVIISEFGAGAFYGCRQRHAPKWSEEYQRDCLDESLRVYLNHRDISGALIWQFCDCRVTAGFWKSRPRTMNNKGTLDEYRRFKLAYEAVKRRLQEARDRRG